MLQLQHARGAASQQLLLLLPLLLLVQGLSAAAAAAAQFSASAHPLRIIAAPLFGISPAMDIMGVVAQLQARGHKVLVVVSAADAAFLKLAAARHTSNTSAEALQYLELNLSAVQEGRSSSSGGGGGGRADTRAPCRPPRQVTHNRFAVPRFPQTLLAGLQLEGVIQDVVAQPCAAVLQDAEAMRRLRAFDADALVSIGIPVPDSAPDSCGCLLSHALHVPFFDVDCGMTFWSGPPSVPQFGSCLTPADLATWRGWALNLAAWSIKQLVQPLQAGLLPNVWAAERDALQLPRASSGCPLVDAWQRAVSGRPVQQCDVLLNVVLGSWLLEHPRPLAPYQVLVGPGTPRPAQPIVDPKVAAFVEGATEGLVLVGVGTSFQFQKWMHPEDYAELSAAFAALAPVKVLWHLKTEALPEEVQAAGALNLAANTRIVSYVEYNDVLGHANTRLFLTHCGAHSVYEAAWHGVPVVGAPFMFEQAEACGRLAATGAAVLCRQAPAFRTGVAAGVRYSRQHVARLLQDVMASGQHAEAAGALASVLQTQARRRQPYAAAADEVELAAYTRRAALQQRRQQQQQHQHQHQHQQGVPDAGGGGGGHAFIPATDVPQEEDRAEL